VAFRCANAANGASAARIAKNRAISRLVVWNIALRYWRHLLGCYNQCARVLAFDPYSAGLSVLIHATETENPSVHVDRRASGCHAAADQLGRRLRTPRRQCLAAFCNRIPLAVSALHGHRLDVSRRLCACRLRRATWRQVQGSLCRLANLTSILGTFRSASSSCNSR